MSGGLNELENIIIEMAQLKLSIHVTTHMKAFQEFYVDMTNLYVSW